MLGQTTVDERMLKWHRQFEFWDVDGDQFLDEEQTFHLLRNIGPDFEQRKICSEDQFKELIRTVKLREDNFFSLDEYLKLCLKAMIVNVTAGVFA